MQKYDLISIISKPLNQISNTPGVYSFPNFVVEDRKTGHQHFIISLPNPEREGSPAPVFMPAEESAEAIEKWRGSIRYFRINPPEEIDMDREFVVQDCRGFHILDTNTLKIHRDLKIQIVKEEAERYNKEGGRNILGDLKWFI